MHAGCLSLNPDWKGASALFGVKNAVQWNSFFSPFSDEAMPLVCSSFCFIIIKKKNFKLFKKRKPVKIFWKDINISKGKKEEGMKLLKLLLNAALLLVEKAKRYILNKKQKSRFERFAVCKLPQGWEGCGHAQRVHEFAMKSAWILCSICMTW